MKKSIKFMALVLALAMCFSAMPMTAFAAAFCNECMVNDMTAPDGLCDECRNQQNATPDGENKVEVSLTVGETWTVKIPKNIVLQAASKGAEYSVEVSGNIAGTKQVKVAPDASFLMSQDGKDDITATITQTKQTVESAEIESGETVTLEGSISAPEATSGTWNGSFNFNIALEEDTPQIISFIVTNPEYDTPFTAEKGMTWEQWANSEYDEYDYFVTEGDYIKYYTGSPSGALIEVSPGVKVNKNDVIIDGHSYEMILV